MYFVISNYNSPFFLLFKFAFKCLCPYDICTANSSLPRLAILRALVFNLYISSLWHINFHFTYDLILLLKHWEFCFCTFPEFHFRLLDILGYFNMDCWNMYTRPRGIKYCCQSRGRALVCGELCWWNLALFILRVYQISSFSKLYCTKYAYIKHK